MSGGTGNDTYYVDNIRDLVIENLGEGTDTVKATISYTLAANIEKLLLTGTAAIDATGNDLANSLTGNAAANTLTGLGGNDILNGGAGADTMIGGTGNDTYYVDNIGDKVTEAVKEGTDTVNSTISFTLGANIEKLVLKGTAVIDGTGNALANTLTGNAADNVLNGMAGADKMIGGAGNDTYFVDNARDVVTELANSGTDTVNASASHTLGANVEQLVLTGTGAINGTGNDLANTLTGNSGNNILNGLGGADTMTGGAGNDTYVIDNAGDTITEALGGGTDTINAAISFTLGANVEKLLLTGTSAIDGTGNDLANTLTGNDAANVLSGHGGADVLVGGGGDDRLIGGTGFDILTGGAGNDRFVFAVGDSARTTTGADEVVDFTSGDKIDVSQIDAQVQASGYGGPGDQAFVFIGQNHFHNQTGGELRYEVVGGNTYVYGETSGDTTADFCIKVDGVHTFSSGDFVL